LKNIFILIAFMVAIIVSLLIGQGIGERRANANAAVEVNGIQADLLFNRIISERKMQIMLSKGCVSEARDALSINEDQDTKLLADFFRGKLSVNAKKYIYDRDPELAKNLGTFKSKYGDSWIEPNCSK
jgi:hypothetical protein